MPRELDVVDVFLLCVSIAASGGASLGIVILAVHDCRSSLWSAVQYALSGSTIGGGMVGVFAALIGDPGWDALASVPIGLLLAAVLGLPFGLIVAAFGAIFFALCRHWPSRNVGQASSPQGRNADPP